MRTGPVQSSDVSDAIDRIGAKGALKGFFPVTEGTAVDGEAMPVLVTMAEDPKPMRAGLIRAVEAAPRGSVLVISSESEAHSVWGGYTSWFAKSRVRGAIVDGAVRDLMQIRKLRFPVFAKQRTPVSGTGRLEVVSVGEPVEIDGLVVSKGDWAVADSDGVVIVPRARADEVKRRLAEVKESESRDKRGLAPKRQRASGASRTRRGAASG